MAMHRLLEVDLSGPLDQARLDALRAALGLTRMGRLTDTMDEEFGYRYLAGPQSADVTLWRRADDRWLVDVTAWPGFRVEPRQLDEVVARIRAAAPVVGLAVSDVRTFAPVADEDFATMNHNENWLRTTHWDLPATTLDELWPVLGLAPTADDETKRARLRAFMTEPAWAPAPERIRREAAEFLA
jgi:hypothetical protein